MTGMFIENFWIQPRMKDMLRCPKCGDWRTLYVDQSSAKGLIYACGSVLEARIADRCHTMSYRAVDLMTEPASFKEFLCQWSAFWYKSTVGQNVRSYPFDQGKKQYIVSVIPHPPWDNIVGHGSLHNNLRILFSETISLHEQWPSRGFAHLPADIVDVTPTKAIKTPKVQPETSPQPCIGDSTTPEGSKPLGTRDPDKFLREQQDKLFRGLFT